MELKSTITKKYKHPRITHPLNSSNWHKWYIYIDSIIYVDFIFQFFIYIHLWMNKYRTLTKNSDVPNGCSETIRNFLLLLFTNIHNKMWNVQRQSELLETDRKKNHTSAVIFIWKCDYVLNIRQTILMPYWWWVDWPRSFGSNVH